MNNICLSLVSVAVVLGSFAQEASAAPKKSTKACQFMITRTPCSDEVKKEALRPYGNEETAPDDDPATTEAACLAAGEKHAKIQRTTVLRKKVVVISFNGKEIGKKEDNSTCTK